MAPYPAQSRPDPVTRAFVFLTERAVSLHAAALLRIGYGLLYLTFLLREFPHRDEIWGPDSPWTPDLARELSHQNGWFSLLTLSDDRAYFEACYILALLTSTVFMLGWHTRVASVLFALVVTSFHGRAVFMTDGGDNLIVLMAIYLTFTACGRRWSLDALRRRLRESAPGRPGPESTDPRSGPSWQQAKMLRSQLTALVHNCGMFVIAAQVCILYGAAGLYKVQGGMWRDGTALHYVLNLDLFQPWPTLSHLADAHDLLIAIAGYVTVLVQVAFPFALFSRLKYVLLGLLIGMHAGIAVLLGLPVFSGAMIVADAVFLPDHALLRFACVGRRAIQRHLTARERRDLPRPRTVTEPPRTP
ncbi:HTTM domain-containing protein [Streptacidiphilus sp. MAP12-20]|uniref:HTTM domain-containing protein n=1 Tax=Streptacidiphilus sp. MAP12-20 TaxID=3156299 RepID=UPI003514DB91